MKFVALITGGTSGVGLATARRFAAGGYDVAICGRTEERLESARKKILAGAEKRECLTFAADFSHPQQAIEFAEKAIANFGQVDVLVNAAAVAPMGPFESITIDQFEEMVNVNLRSLFYLTQTVWRSMKENRRGVVVNISSMAAVSPFTGFSAYGASKAWLDLLTCALADEGRPHGLLAFSIRPGTIETPMLRGLFPDYPSDQTLAPDSVADVVWQLTQPTWQFSSGEAIAVSRQS
jgi:NAD(P)-dependent dehydrogenase (short-subunit alcohol dehydrogenase family)